MSAMWAKEGESQKKQMSNREHKDEPDIGWDGVAHLDLDDIARNNFARRNDNSLTIPYDSSRGGAQGAQRVHGLLGRVLLKEAHHHVEDDDSSNNSAFNVRFDAIADSHGQNQHLSR
jgi:hypothetical protein